MDKFNVFISYSRLDFDEVNALRKILEKQSISSRIWFDINGIESGDEFSDKIVSAIENCNIVLFMVSKNSMNSIWTKKEITYAKNIGKRIIPILLEGAKLHGWFLFEFGNIDFIDSQNAKEVSKLIENLDRWNLDEDMNEANMLDKVNINTAEKNLKTQDNSPHSIKRSQKFLNFKFFDLTCNVYITLMLFMFVLSIIWFIRAEYPTSKTVAITAILTSSISIFATWSLKHRHASGYWIDVSASTLFLLITSISSRFSVMPFLLLLTCEVAICLLLGFVAQMEDISLNLSCIWKLIAKILICLLFIWGCMVLPAVCSTNGFKGIPFFNRFAAEYILAECGSNHAQIRISEAYEQGKYYVNPDSVKAQYWRQRAQKSNK